jgi:hypothetical protein
MSSFEATKVRPNMSQVVALSMTYRLFYKVLKAPLVLLLALPIALRLSYFIFDRLTNDHTLLSLIMTAALTSSFRQLILQMAPTKADQQDALAKTSIGLPCLMFAVTCGITNFVLSPLETALGIRSFLTWSPVLTLSLALRACALTLFLGLSVLLRYVGPPSVMRCSSSPLLAHPFQTSLQRLMSKLTMNALLDLIAGSDMPNQATRAPLDFRANARRYQTPLWNAAISQIVISISLSLGVAYMSVLPLFSDSRTHGETSFKVSIILACIIASLTQLARSALNGRLHELDPIRHQSHLSWKSSSRLLVRLTAGSLVIPLLLVLGSAILARSHYYMGDEEKSGDGAAEGEQMGFILACSFVTGSTIYLFLEAFDETVRHLLTTYSSNMRTLVEEIADDDSMETFLDVAIHSLVHSDSSLVNALGSPSKPNFHDLEREELRRNESATKAMATNLLRKSMADETSAHLEEDTLRLAILASFGGGKNLERASPTIEINIRSWIEPEKFAKMTISKGEPGVVPLVRALCAYLGGLGEALFICSGQKGPTLLNPWLLPPGAIVCATYAVRAATRLILFNLSVSTKILTDWRSTHLSMLIPVFLTSAHQLETGMVKFAQERLLENSTNTRHLGNMDLFRLESPELLPLYQTIFECSLAILERLKSLEGIRRVNFTVNLECSRWIDSILAKIPDQSSSSSSGQASPRSVVPVKALF